MIEKETIERILAASKLTEVASDFMTLTKSGKDMHAKCPQCLKDGKGKGMFFDDKKDLFKCFSCGTGGKGSLGFLMQIQKMDYIAAIKHLGDKYVIDYNADAQKILEAQQADQRKGGKGKKTFVDIQLHASGLDVKDVKAKVYKDADTTSTFETSPFALGTLNDYFQLLPGVGNDMIIYYYDLEGHQVMFKHEKKTKFEPFFRVRFQNPEARRDKFSKPIKYYSPAGSGTHLYIPEKIRQMYKKGLHIETLFIQEGEKKAEKSCKHDILSVGVMGIHNVGSANVMPKDLMLLIQKCNVKKVVFMLDSDWQDISTNIKSGDNPQRRPLTFFYAVKNFKEYMISFRNIGVNLEVYFGAVKKNDKNEKGIDDVLAGSFKAIEPEFLTDISAAILSKSGEGKHCDIFKITSLTDFQIKEFWKLNSVKDFAERHKEILVMIPEFTVNKTRYRFNEAGEFELAEPILPEERYWEFDQKGVPDFRYKRSMTFLRNRGYGRLQLGGKWAFVHFQNHIATVVDRQDIKSFVLEVTEQIASEDVQEMMLKGGHYYLGPDKLENLKPVDIHFETPGKTFQNMHFRNKFIKITENKIEEFDPSQRIESVWADQMLNFDVSIFNDQLINFEPVPDNILSQLRHEDMRFQYIDQKRKAYSLAISDEGSKCHFLSFLINASNFHHRETKSIYDCFSSTKKDYDTYIDISMHLLSKLTALGYLCHRYHNASVAKAVIGVDGKLSEVGTSNGRSGKSLFGKAIEHVVPQVYIGGKAKNLTEDQFLFEEVNEKTQNVFFDDVRTNIDFEFFFPNITGKWKINAKGTNRFTLPDRHPIKLYFSTNHMINGDGGSFAARMHHIVFSDFYNENWQPVNDFGMLFFDDWDQTQWNYFYNLVAASLQLYFRFGLVEAPSRQIEKRRLRQMMGEEFLTWAEEYYSDGVNPSAETPFAVANLEMRINRKEIYENFKGRLRGKIMDFYTTTRFGRCIKWYCQYKEYHFNPHKPNDQNENITDFLSKGGRSFQGIEDKTSGVEYFTVSRDVTTNPATKFYSNN